MKKLLYILLCIGGISAANAGDCDWATVTPQDDANYKYFVSKSYSETSASDAANKAEQDIDAQIGRLFGTKLDVQSEFYSDEIGASGTTRSYERAIGMITLKGLERQRSDVEETTNGWTGCVQYRYLKSEINAEKQRLQSMSPDELQASLRFTEVVGDTQCRGTPVEIVTVPAGAYVTIDNGKYQGSAPIKFGNVCDGKYTLEITKENYEPITEQLIVPTSGRITKTLKRGTKTITVRTSLGNSNIAINGVDYGKEPIKFNAPLGIEQSITATNAEATKVTQTRIFSYESDEKYTISMTKLPGKIDFSAFKARNPGVEIYVNGAVIVGNTSAELAPDMEHNVTLSKKDFVDIHEAITLTGGDITYYPSQPRNFSKDNSNWAQGRLGLAGLAFVGSTYSNNDFGINAGLELATRLRLNDTFGVRGGIGLQWSKLNINSSQLNYDYYKYQFNQLPTGSMCPAGQNCQYATFYQHDSSGGYNDTFWGYFSTDPTITPKESLINWEYYEPFYLNMGVIAWEKLYFYGIGAIGFLEGTATNQDKYIPVPASTLKSTIFRFGAGIQWNIGKLYGIRFQYLTSGKKISLPYELDTPSAYIGADSREHNDPNYIWLYRGEIKNMNPVQDTIDAIESISLSFFIGF